MCVIVDTNVVAQMFGTAQTPGGIAFRERVESGLALVAGGELLRELDGNGNFRDWRRIAARIGVFQIVSENDVARRTEALRKEKRCESDDEHVIAVAQVGGARLLFTNDGALQKDFKNKALVDEPRGRIYSPQAGGDVSPHQKRLLNNATCLAG